MPVCAATQGDAAAQLELAALLVAEGRPQEAVAALQVDVGAPGKPAPAPSAQAVALGGALLTSGDIGGARAALAAAVPAGITHVGGSPQAAALLAGSAALQAAIQDGGAAGPTPTLLGEARRHLQHAAAFAGRQQWHLQAAALAHLLLAVVEDLGNNRKKVGRLPSRSAIHPRCR